MKVRLLTIEQKDLLTGQVWGYQGQLFNPVQDNDNNWILSNEEVQGCTLSQALALGCDAWLLSLPEIDFNPKISNNLEA